MKTTRIARLKKLKTVAVISDAIRMTVRNGILMGFSQYSQSRHDIAVRCINSLDVRKSGVLNGCDAAMVISFLPDVVEYVKATGLPTAFFGSSVSPGVLGISTDAAQSGIIAAEWFIRRGFKNFAFCGKRGISGTNILELQEKSFSDTVTKAGFECRIFDEAAITKNSFGLQHLENLLLGLEKWIPTLPPRTAILCTNDNRALHVLNTCIKLGRAVPDDIAIMGRRNDVAVCSCAPVPLTSIDMNLPGVGCATLRILSSAIDKPVKPKVRPTFRVPLIGIVERDSTAVYPIDPPWLAKTLLLIDANLDLAFNMSSLAEAAGVSEKTLDRAFHKAFGTSAGKYVMSVKMREAKRLVDAGNHSVKEIAAHTGFSSANHFSRAYRNFYGHPPSKGQDARQTRRNA